MSGHHVYINDYDMSCGVHTLSGTSNNLLQGAVLREDIAMLCNVAKANSDPDEDHENRAAFYLGSDVRGGPTERFFEELRFLGHVHRSAVRKNPNTGSDIVIWTWAPSQKKMRAWLTVNYPKGLLPSQVR
jgi:hypothetical protein